MTDASVSHSDKRESRTGTLSYLPDMCEAIVRTIGVDEHRVPAGAGQNPKRDLAVLIETEDQFSQRENVSSNPIP